MTASVSIVGWGGVHRMRGRFISAEANMGFYRGRMLHCIVA